MLTLLWNLTPSVQHQTQLQCTHFSTFIETQGLIQDHVLEEQYFLLKEMLLLNCIASTHLYRKGGKLRKRCIAIK